MPKTQSSAVRGFRALFRAGRGDRGRGADGGVSLGALQEPGPVAEAPKPKGAPVASLVEQLEPRQFLSVSIQNGFTVVTPDAGSRVVHVSSSGGNDRNP